MDKLKPCPFCGETKLRIQSYSDVMNEMHQGFIECMTCSASLWGPPRKSHPVAIDSAIEAWNRRVGERDADR